jgi:hypothetical protein
VWVFDPLDRLGWPEPMVWNPVAGCRDGETVLSHGLAFAAGLGADDKSSTNGGFFRANAASALTRTYDVQADHMVLPCWLAHRGVAEELAALRTAWQAAGRGTQPGDAMIDWHDRCCTPRSCGCAESSSSGHA